MPTVAALPGDEADGKTLNRSDFCRSGLPRLDVAIAQSEFAAASFAASRSYRRLTNAQTLPRFYSGL